MHAPMQGRPQDTQLQQGEWEVADTSMRKSIEYRYIPHWHIYICSPVLASLLGARGSPRKLLKQKGFMFTRVRAYVAYWGAHESGNWA